MTTKYSFDYGASSTTNAEEFVDNGQELNSDKFDEELSIFGWNHPTNPEGILMQIQYWNQTKGEYVDDWLQLSFNNLLKGANTPSGIAPAVKHSVTRDKRTKKRIRHNANYKAGFIEEFIVTKTEDGTAKLVQVIADAKTGEYERVADVGNQQAAEEAQRAATDIIQNMSTVQLENLLNKKKGKQQKTAVKAANNVDTAEPNLGANFI